MIMTELQYASLVISLSTLGQVEITGIDPEMLRTLEYLLEEAHANVKRTIAALEPAEPGPIARVPTWEQVYTEGDDDADDVDTDEE